MKLNLEKLESGSEKFVLPVKKDEIDPAIARLEADGTLKLTIYNEDTAEYVCEAELNASIMLECSRCLKEISYPIETSFSIVLKPVGEEEDEDDENTVYYDPQENEADLSGIVVDIIGVNIPMRPICEDDCKGLCEKCGTNLNLAACNCKTEKTDPAWEVLRKLKGE